MNLYTKLTDTGNKLMVIKGESWRRGRQIRCLGLTRTPSTHKTDNQQEPTVWHRKLYWTFCNNL